MDRQSAGRWRGYVETALMFSLCVFSASIFFSQTGISVFGPISLLLLLIHRYALGVVPHKKVPLFVVVVVSLFVLDMLFGAIISDNRREGFNQIKNYWNIALGGLLFSCSLTVGRRRVIAGIFFAAAVVAGTVGLLQSITDSARAHGFAHPIHYATLLSFAGATALMLLLIKNDAFEGKWSKALLLITSVSAFAGMLLSQTRGVWIAFIVSVVGVLAIHSIKKAAALAVVFAVILSSVFAFSGSLRERAFSIFSSYWVEDEYGSTGNRIELWKGAVLIFKESPVFGTGIGDFTPDIERLKEEGRIKPVPVDCHAHSIYFQWLSTQGAVGLILLVSLIAVLLAWGMREIGMGNVGGYIIVLTTTILAIGGLTENNVCISKIFSAYCFTIGLFGGMAAIIDLKTPDRLKSF